LSIHSYYPAPTRSSRGFAAAIAIFSLFQILLALLVSGWRYHGEASAPLTSGVGLIAGLLSGAEQLGGPPVVAYWLGGKSDFTRVRA
ncbi:hypothetical protein AB9F38_34395, partial [Rhizobium leguminosarum]